MSTTSRPRAARPASPPGITSLTVSGFKSIREEATIEIAPLTILAGANSSGKSSIMQPLLLLKQTLEAPYDPGPLLLDGPNIAFTSIDQLLSRDSKHGRASALRIGFTAGQYLMRMTYRPAARNKGFEIVETTVGGQNQTITVKPNMSGVELQNSSSYFKSMAKEFGLPSLDDRLAIERNRCYLQPVVIVGRANGTALHIPTLPLGQDIATLPKQALHLPGLRGNPARTYHASAGGGDYAGVFDKYVAGIISEWQNTNDDEPLNQLGEDLRKLDLTWKVSAVPLNDTQVELRVGRLNRPARGGARDMVSIADVGFGVSQTLPVLVALRVAKRGQLVYLEQPEIHLHPRAQVALGEILVDAAKRGVRVVAETHSSLLILAIQSLVAESQVDPKIIRLYWFHRGEDGCTQIETGRLDAAGAFGQWPEDFDTVLLETQSRYLDAAERRLIAK